MSITRSASWLLVAVAGASLAANFSCATPDASSPPAQAVDPVARGEYLTTIMGCNDCHTPGYLYGAPDDTRKLSGSEVGWAGPWGVAFAANLTPDPETGLGNWSDEEIITALKTGQRPDGRMLAPFMPYQNFASLTDEDVQAIVAYLRSLPPIVHAEPAPVPPGETYAGTAVQMPPPSAWDVPPQQAQ